MTANEWGGEVAIAEVSAGDMMLEQTASVDHYVKLDNDLKTRVAASMFSFTTASSETIFYPAELRSGARIYCSTNMASLEVVTGERICLSDEDQDGKFERLWNTDETNGSTGVFAIHVYEMAEYIENPVPYTVYNEGEMPTENIGVRFKIFTTVFGDKSVQIEYMRQTPSGRWQPASSSDEKLLNVPLEDFRPAAFQVFSARLMVLEASADKLRYTIIEPFAEGEALYPYKLRGPRVVY